MLLEAAPDDIVLEEGVAKVAGTDRSIPIESAGARRLSSGASLQGEIEPGIAESATYDPAGTFANACHAAIVEVDPETGQVRIESFIAAEDAGRLINPMIVDGQIHGGIAQGIGNALLEEIIYDRPATFSPHARRLSAADRRMRSRRSSCSISKLSATPRSRAPRGVGEGGAIGAPAAVINAINDALVAIQRRDQRNPCNAAAHPCGDPRRQASARATRMSDKRDITLIVNGRELCVEVEPRRTLVDAIREDCGQTGTHIGCEHGVCGACTVLVDGAPVRVVPDVRGAGRRQGNPHGRRPWRSGQINPLQRAFMEHHGLQCGFCTPGFLMLVTGVLEREPDIGDDELLDVLPPTSAAAPAIRTSSRRCARPRTTCGSRSADRMSGTLIGRSVTAAGRPAAAHRGAAALRRMSRSRISCTCASCARPTRMRGIRDRYDAGARAARASSAVWTAADVADVPPIDFRLTRHRGARALSPARPRHRSAALCRRAGRRRVC